MCLQVVAGMNYKLKLAVGDEYWHCTVYKPLPHTGEPAVVTEDTLEKGKTESDDL